MLAKRNTIGGDGMKNHDPNYGDNTICDLCKAVFDARNSPHEVIGDKWICDSCLSQYDNDELREMLSPL
jgi:hypothetical protein